MDEKLGGQRVLIVGAGVAGLQTLRALRRVGINTVCLEAGPDVGGVWQRNYQGYCPQVPYDMYEFPEFPYPPHVRPQSEYVEGGRVQMYIRAYAEHFDLYSHIRLMCRLTSLVQRPDNTWTASYKDHCTGQMYELDVDYVILCTGVFSIPYIPELPGQSLFRGGQIHSKNFVDASAAKGRDIVVVGAGKTALDMLAEVTITRIAHSVTLLYRQAHWPIPRYLGKKGVREILFTRHIANQLRPYYAAGPLTKLGNAIKTPLRKLFWWRLENQFAKTMNVHATLGQPAHHLDEDLFYTGQVMDVTWPLLLKANKVKIVKGEIMRLTPTSLILKDGSEIQCDFVLYATGYNHTYPFLDPNIVTLLEGDCTEGGFYLWRNMIPPKVKNLAFVGAEATTLNCILTYGLQAEWMANYLLGLIKKPDEKEMVRDTLAQKRWKERVVPPGRNRNAALMLYMHEYHDQLMRDMGLRPGRKQGFNCFAEHFSYYSARDYWGIYQELTERRQRVLGGTKQLGAAARRGGMPSCLCLSLPVTKLKLPGLAASVTPSTETSDAAISSDSANERASARAEEGAQVVPKTLFERAVPVEVKEEEEKRPQRTGPSVGGGRRDSIMVRAGLKSGFWHWPGIHTPVNTDGSPPDPSANHNEASADSGQAGTSSGHVHAHGVLESSHSFVSVSPNPLFEGGPTSPASEGHHAPNPASSTDQQHAFQEFLEKSASIQQSSTVHEDEVDAVGEGEVMDIIAPEGGDNCDWEGRRRGPVSAHAVLSGLTTSTLTSPRGSNSNRRASSGGGPGPLMSSRLARSCKLAGEAGPATSACIFRGLEARGVQSQALAPPSPVPEVDAEDMESAPDGSRHSMSEPSPFGADSMLVNLPTPPLCSPRRGGASLAQHPHAHSHQNHPMDPSDPTIRLRLNLEQHYHVRPESCPGLPGACEENGGVEDQACSVSSELQVPHLARGSAPAGGACADATPCAPSLAPALESIAELSDGRSQRASGVGCSASKGLEPCFSEPAATGLITQRSFQPLLRCSGGRESSTSPRPSTLPAPGYTPQVSAPSISSPVGSRNNSFTMCAAEGMVSPSSSVNSLVTNGTDLGCLQDDAVVRKHLQDGLATGMPLPAQKYTAFGLRGAPNSLAAANKRTGRHGARTATGPLSSGPTGMPTNDTSTPVLMLQPGFGRGSAPNSMAMVGGPRPGSYSVTVPRPSMQLPAEGSNAVLPSSVSLTVGACRRAGSLTAQDGSAAASGDGPADGAMLQVGLASSSSYPAPLVSSAMLQPPVVRGSKGAALRSAPDVSTLGQLTWQGSTESPNTGSAGSGGALGPGIDASGHSSTGGVLLPTDASFSVRGAAGRRGSSCVADGIASGSWAAPMTTGGTKSVMSMIAEATMHNMDIMASNDSRPVQEDEDATANQKRQKERNNNGLRGRKASAAPSMSLAAQLSEVTGSDPSTTTGGNGKASGNRVVAMVQANMDRLVDNISQTIKENLARKQQDHSQQRLQEDAWDPSLMPRGLVNPGIAPIGRPIGPSCASMQELAHSLPPGVGVGMGVIGTVCLTDDIKEGPVHSSGSSGNSSPRRGQHHQLISFSSAPAGGDLGQGTHCQQQIKHTLQNKAEHSIKQQMHGAAHGRHVPDVECERAPTACGGAAMSNGDSVMHLGNILDLDDEAVVRV